MPRRHGLGHGCLLETEPGRCRVGECRVDRDKGADRAIDGRSGEEDHAGAVVVAPGQALRAAAAGNSGFEGDDLAAGELTEGSDLVFQFRAEWLAQCEAEMPAVGALQPLWKRSVSGVALTGQARQRRARNDRARDRGRAAHPDLFPDRCAGRGTGARDAYAGAGVVPPVNDALAAEIVGHRLDCILENISDTVRLSKAANLAGMSESAFSRYFHRASGQNCTAFVRRLRLAHAAKLLQQTGDAVARIALAVGYQNLSNFNRQFLRECGQAPTRYRSGVREVSRPEPVLSTLW